jgi:HK97 family phage major capsid protein
MEIAELIAATTPIPIADLTTLAATRAAFGDDVLTAFRTQIELRTTAAQTVLDAATAAQRDALLASEQRSYDGQVRERDAILGLQRAIEQRTEQRAFVPESQRPQPEAKKKSGLFGLELRALGESGGAGAVIAPAEWASTFIDRLAAESVMLRAGIRRMTTTRDALHIPRIDSDPTAAWTAEAAPIAASDPGYTDLIATPRKLASLQTISNELIADSNPDVVALLEMQTARALALKFDLGCFEGSGVPPEIRGLKNVVGITNDATLAAAPANLDVFANAITTLEANNAKATAIVMHPRTWGTLLKLKEGTAANNKPLLQDSAGSGSQGVQRAIYGVPVYLSSQLATNEGTGESSAYVFDASQIVAVFRQDTTILLDRSRLFNTDQSELRAILRADLIVPNPLAVVRISKIVTAATASRAAKD